MREDDIIRNLGRLLDAQSLSTRVTKQAVAIHEVLTRPKRVTLMGPPKSGKYDLLALLAGKRVVDTEVTLGTITLVYGDQANTVMEMSDGTIQEINGVPSAKTFVTEVAPINTTIAVPLPALKKISLMRLAEANTFEDQVKAMTWAAGESDIVIWCTTRFGLAEKKMWAEMPERVRDHAFVVRTSLGEFDQNIAAARSDLGKLVGDEFAFVLAADLKVALSAQVSVPINTERMKKSGATTIISMLLKEIEEGRENALNHAELILAKYPASGEASNKTGQAKIKPAKPKLVAEDADVQQILANVAKAAPVSQKNQIDDAINDLVGGKTEKSSDTARSTSPSKRKNRNLFPVFETNSKGPAADVEASPAKPVKKPSRKKAADAVARPGLSDETIVMCKDMIVRLSGLGIPYVDSSDHRSMFDAGLQTLSWIDEALADVANDDVSIVSDLQRKTEEATDIIQLLRLEGDDTAALDAVTILLQMKRSLQALLAS